MSYADAYPTHSRTSCSDEDPCNFDVEGTGCFRCNALLFDRHTSALADLQTQKARAERWREIAINMHSWREMVRKMTREELGEAYRATQRTDPHLAALYAAMLQETP